MRISVAYKIAFVYLVGIFTSAFGVASKTVLYKSDTLEQAEGLSLYAPLDFSQPGELRRFLQNIYNDAEYVQEVLPENLGHVIQCLEFISKTQQSRAHVKAILKLFTNKIKGAPYLNAQAFVVLAEKMPDLLGRYFSIQKVPNSNRYKETINSILYSTFLSKYEFFKKNPQEFFETLSQDIVDAMNSDLPLVRNEDILLEDLRYNIVRFLEVCLSKLLWSPADHAHIWDSVKKISTNLESLLIRNVLDESIELDDLYWSLIHRFCYFLDNARGQLPSEFYEKVKHEIATQPLLLLELAEQEPMIESKAKYCMRKVLAEQAKKQASEQGIIVQ